ncbi:MAG TPA: hypothetical protein PKE63_01510 [Lacibacter sp.]|nr:hypothetical protein [Lacibacter sp.]HMO87776.1 hypothetical protein [Lacibacter sp.]HMP85920.1 hypothetical protein [Lacibacter sp.]
MRNRTSIALYVAFLLTVCVHSSYAQIGLSSSNSRFEIGLNVGPMNFLGDLGGNRGKGTLGPKDNNIPVTNMIGGISASYYPTEWIGFRIAGNLGRMEGDDRLIRQSQPADTWEGARKFRNLTFRSPLYEAYAGIELYPTAMISLRNGTGLPRFRPYLIGGVGLFKFNPQGLYTDPNGNETWIDLRPLRLEGQGMVETGVPEYSLVSYNIPLGIGIKYDLTERLTFGIELIHRITGSDYIDDVSRNYIDPNLFDIYLPPSQALIARQMANPSSFYPSNTPGYTPYRIGRPRGNPKRNDSYFASTFRLTWKIGDVYADWFKNRKSMRCPQYF